MNYPIEYKIKIQSNNFSWETNPLWKALLNLAMKREDFVIMKKDEKTGEMIVQLKSDHVNEEFHHLCLQAFGIKASIGVVV